MKFSHYSMLILCFAPSILCAMHKLPDLDKYFMVRIKDAIKKNKNEDSIKQLVSGYNQTLSDQTLMWALTNIVTSKKKAQNNQQKLFEFVISLTKEDQPISLPNLLRYVEYALNYKQKKSLPHLTKIAKNYLQHKKHPLENNFSDRKAFAELARYIFKKYKIDYFPQAIVIATLLEETELVIQLLKDPYTLFTQDLLGKMLFANYKHGTKKDFKKIMTCLFSMKSDIHEESFSPLFEVATLWNNILWIKKISQYLESKNHTITESNIGYSLEYATEENIKNISNFFLQNVAFRSTTLAEAIKNTQKTPNYLLQKQIMRYIIQNEYRLERFNYYKNKTWYKQLKKMMHGKNYLKKYNERCIIPTLTQPYNFKKHNYLNFALLFDHPEIVSQFCNNYSLPLEKLLHNTVTWFSPRSMWLLLTLIGSQSVDDFVKYWKEVTKRTVHRKDKTLQKTATYLQESLCYWSHKKTINPKPENIKGPHETTGIKRVPALPFTLAAYLHTFIDQSLIKL